MILVIFISLCPIFQYLISDSIFFFFSFFNAFFDIQGSDDDSDNEDEDDDDDDDEEDGNGNVYISISVVLHIKCKINE